MATPHGRRRTVTPADACADTPPPGPPSWLGTWIPRGATGHSGHRSWKCRIHCAPRRRVRRRRPPPPPNPGCRFVGIG
ncbi:hypothetical protein ACFPM0_28115 [Pseudonocardia sulfidoxydans]|uniref:hypothetical protein n=1 Tax=Pseudonocardia sulfidoxydans TaxID=54011 RepID=UPI003612821E